MNNFPAVPQPGSAYLTWALIGVILLMVGSLIVARLSRRNTNSYDNMLIGEKKSGPIITAFALLASIMSGWTGAGGAGMIYTYGWSAWWYAASSWAFGYIPLMAFISLKARDYVVKHGARSLPELLGIRFNSKAAQSVLSVSMIILTTVILIAQYKSVASGWFALTGQSAAICLLICTIFAAAYIILGGFIGTQWSLAYQAIIIFIGLMITGIACLKYIGGFDALNARLAAQDPNLLVLFSRSDLSKTGFTQFFTGIFGLVMTFIVTAIIVNGVPYGTTQVMSVTKLTRKSLAIMVIITVVFNMLIVYPAVIMGLASRAVFGNQLLNIAPWRGDLAAPMISMQVGGVPLATIYIVALFACAISTIAAVILLISSSITRGLVQLWRPQTSVKSLSLISRTSIVIFLLIAYAWTFFNPPPLMAVFQSYAMYGLSIPSIFSVITSFWWKRATKEGAIASIIVGFVLCVALGILVANGRLGMATYALILILVCGGCYFIVSLLTSPPPREVLDKIFGETVKNSSQ